MTISKGFSELLGTKEVAQSEGIEALSYGSTLPSETELLLNLLFGL